MLFAILLFISVSSVVQSTGINFNDNENPDLVKDLPGLDITPAFNHYSGYLDGTTDNYKLHYWFVEAEKNLSSAPLVLWLNGGPGCSSLEGFLSENGPFTFANVLYLEAPAGVGFSYSVDGNVTTDDDLTAENSYAALLNFLKKFPDYKDREFFITGESYAGVYVPTLALQVLSDRNNSLNLKGIAVGNGLTSYELNDNSLIYFINYHGLIDETTWKDTLFACCGSQCANKCMFTRDNSTACQNQIAIVNGVLSGLNIYNLYSPCYGGVPSSFAEQTMKHPHALGRSRSKRPELYNLFRDNAYIQRERLRESNAMTIPCVDSTRIQGYLNRDDVREALHIPKTVTQEWDVCSDEVYQNYGRTYDDLSKQYLGVLDEEVPVMLFAGDIDMACNYHGLLWFVDNLGLKMENPMEHWLYKELDGTNQVGGVTKKMLHNNTALTYVTVRGSGHMVPEDKPVAAYHMITRFIQGKEL